MSYLSFLQKRLKSLLKGMSAMEGKEVLNTLINRKYFLCTSKSLFFITYKPLFFQGALSSSAVGSIVGLQSEEISQIASEYAERVRTVYCVSWLLHSDLIMTQFYMPYSTVRPAFLELVLKFFLPGEVEINNLVDPLYCFSLN